MHLVLAVLITLQVGLAEAKPTHAAVPAPSVGQATAARTAGDVAPPTLAQTDKRLDLVQAGELLSKVPRVKNEAVARIAEHLKQTLERVERLEHLVPEGMDLPEMALRFILEHQAVSTVIPGMRRQRHVERNLAVSDGEPLAPRLRDALRQHRWDRPQS